jgi:hypothetical protein
VLSVVVAGTEVPRSMTITPKALRNIKQIFIAFTI